MADVARREAITDAVIAALEAAEGGHPVGDHQEPDDTSERYTIIYGVPGGTLDGSWAYPSEDGVFVYQVDSYGRSRQQCEWLADRNRDRLLAGTISPTGWKVMRVVLQVPGAVENEGVDETGAALFACRERFEVYTTSP